MQIQNHILSILQLYEYAMAIGKSLDFKENSDSFIKLLLKRQNLNAAWLLKKTDVGLKTCYSFPKGEHLELPNREIIKLLDSINYSLVSLNEHPELNSILPLPLTSGNIVVLNLDDVGYLILYTQKDNLTKRELTQLKPVIDKFTNSLKACMAYEEQQQLLTNLETRNQELSDYAHMVSHDLKSPLRSIDTMSSWLQDDYKESIDNAGQQHLAVVRENVEKMDNLIDGILRYASVDKNKTEAYPVDLNTIIKDITTSIHVPEKFKIISSELPTVLGDTARFKQLFQNLITNAITYNDKENGFVEIKALDKSNHWEFQIKDNGKGIEEKYFDKIFKTFEKLENKKGSTGIGLSIVKKIIDFYKGKIWVTSQINEGTTFYFTFLK